MKTFSLANANVLIIDDTSLMRASHKKMLMTMGIKEDNMAFAENGAEGLSELANMIKSKGRVDLIICDWDMPKVNGIQVLEKVRQVPIAQKIPFIMITGHADKADIITAIKKGVDAYMVKPLKEEDFQDKIIEGLLIGFIRL